MHPFTVRALLWAPALVLQSLPLAAQTTVARQSDTSIFAPLTLQPAPSAVRLASGAPGPKYWQNRADYDLKATLDTATQMVQGSMVLRYTNNSSDTLKVLWFQTEQRDEVIDQFDQLVNGKPVSLTRQHPDDDVFELKVTPAEPLTPGQTATFQLQWHFPVPTDGGRSGHSGTLYEIAQWYPRPNVYDDVKGWNTESYATDAEFYLEYGDYTMAVTLPANYIVAGTGTLDNPRDVLTPIEIARLAQAMTVDTVVHVVTADELASGTAHLKHEGMVTWKFHATNVRDAVWAASPDYQWDATHWKGVLAQAFYPSTADASWHEAADMVRTSLQEYSDRWFPYPYPHASVAEGPLTGMEYPMLAWIPTFPRKPRLYYSITHEVGHNWFPMIVGSNERVHAWMDEGLNTFLNSFSESRRYPENGDQAARISQDAFTSDGTVLETGDVTGNSGAQYTKTAQVLQLLRRDVLSPVVFDSAFRSYIRRWAFKHPTPMDFFRTLEDVSGSKLDWFWREGFLEALQFDQGIDSVTQTVQGDKTHVTVTYGNKGRAVLPILVRFTFSDGTTQDVTHPVEVWRANPATYTMSYTFSPKKVSRIVLDPENHLPDAEQTNNVWSAP